MTSHASRPPVRFGCAGIGGYAWFICWMLLEEAKAAEPLARLVAVCDPEPERFPARVEQLTTAGVRIVRGFDQLLEEPIEAVWLPLPIDLHRPFAEAALAAGKAVVTEKPAAGSVDDVDAMIAARDRSGLPVAVGFQDVFRPEMLDLKARLLAGEFGRVRDVTLLGCWPRGSTYYTRNDWAGRIARDGRWVMDCPTNNAFAHPLHLALFLLGRTMDAAASPTQVVAELYRANAIETYDTCTLRVASTAGVDVIVALTHACAEDVTPVVQICAERATLRYVVARELSVDFGYRRDVLPLTPKPYREILRTFGTSLSADRDAAGAVGGTLEMARAHTTCVNAASEATAVVDVPVEYVESIAERDGETIRTISGIVPALRACAGDRLLLHETGLVPWSRPAGQRSCAGYGRFGGPLQGS